MIERCECAECRWIAVRVAPEVPQNVLEAAWPEAAMADDEPPRDELDEDPSAPGEIDEPT